MNNAPQTHPRYEGRGAQPPYYAGPSEETGVRELWRKLWRQKLVVAATTILLTVVALVGLFMMTPEYTAVNRVVIDARQPEYRPVAKSDDNSAASYVDAQALQTQVHIIRSPAIIEKIIEKTGLDSSPEFNEALRPASFVQRAISGGLRLARALEVMAGQGDFLHLGGLDEDGATQSDSDHSRNRIINAVLDKLEVIPEGLSSVIKIDFSSQDSQTAAAVANSAAEFYIAGQLDAKAQAAKKANDWVNERVAELRADVQNSEEAAQTFAAQKGLTKGRDGTPASQRIAQLSIELAQAQADRMLLEARLKQMSFLTNSSTGIESASGVLSSPLIVHLRQQEAVVQNKLAELTQEFGDRNFKIIDSRAAVADIKAKIRLEATRITDGVRNDVVVARAREKSLTERLEETKSEIARLDESEVKLRPLQREAEANRNLYESFLLRSKQIIDQTQTPDAHVLSVASAPEKPTFPRRGPLLLLSAVGAFFIGILVALWTDHLDPGFRSLEQISGRLGVRPLSLVPALAGFKVGRKVPPESYVLARPRSRYCEAIRALAVGLIDHGPNRRRALIVLISSSLPNEGKTSLTLSLSRLLAASNQRVLILDCDLRKPSAHRAFEVTNSPGLAEYLRGEASPDEIMRQDHHSAATLIPAGEQDSNPTMLLGSDKMKRLLATAAMEYDWIIMDSSPIMAVADARLLARLADKTVFIVRWAKTRRETVQLALGNLLEADADIAGVVLTRVDLKKHTQYSYGNPAYYGGGIKRYYVG